MKNFVDLHCDTMSAIFDANEDLYKNNLHIDIKKLMQFENVVLVFALWLKKEFNKNAFFYANKMLDFFENQVNINKQYIKIANNFNQILQNIQNKKFSAILSIESSICLEGRIENLDYFYKRGIRILNICWNYENELGYGVLAKSNDGLKNFGKEVIEKMNSLKMIIDVSHLNKKGFWDVYNLAKYPFIASHSNSYFVCNNIRNLDDSQLKAIKEKGGLVGLNFYPPFLTNESKADFCHIFSHIDYLIKLIGSDSICLGGDLDGIDKTPSFIKDITSYKQLFSKIESKYGIDTAEKIFFSNFYNFAQNNL